MNISVPKTDFKAAWFFLQQREVPAFSSEFSIPNASAKALKTGTDLFSLAAAPKMTAGAPSEEEGLSESQWFEQEEAKIADIQEKWENGSAYDSAEDAQAWINEIVDLQADIDASPYLDEDTKAIFDARFQQLYIQPAINGSTGTPKYGDQSALTRTDGLPMTIGDLAFGYTANDGSTVDPDFEVLSQVLQRYSEQTENNYANLNSITIELQTISRLLDELSPEPTLAKWEWYDQELAELELIQQQWENGTAYNSAMNAETWMEQIAGLQAEIDASPYIDEDTKALFDAQFQTIYSQPALNPHDLAQWNANNFQGTIGDFAFGCMITRSGQSYPPGTLAPPNTVEVSWCLQGYHRDDTTYADSGLKNITNSLQTIQEMLLELDPGPPIHVSAIDAINGMYADLLDQMNELAKNPENMNPSEMLLLQFTMMQLSQLTEAMSNTLAGFGSISATVVRNFK